MATIIETGTLSVLDYVELCRAVERFGIGTRGTIVEANPKYGIYTVEVSDEEGRTLELLPCERQDLVLIERL